MNQYDLPLDEQVAGLDPETKATHRRMLNRQRQKVGPKSKWLFEQMYKAVDEHSKRKGRNEARISCPTESPVCLPPLR